MSTDIPVTIWRNTSGLGEYSSETPNHIVDTSSNNLADPSGNLIVDTGVTFTNIPDTIWAEDDSV